MNQTIKELNERKSIRVFRDEPVPEEIQAEILNAAFQAPTAGCQMLYSILRITDKGLKETLAEKCDHQPFIAKAPFVLIFLADVRRWLDLYKTAHCSPRKPGPGDALLAMADAVIAAENAVTAAHSLGLGSCYIGDILENCEDIRGLLKLPPEVFPAAMLVIGYPDEKQLQRKKPSRFERRYIVFDNTYKTLSVQEQKDMYLERETKEGRTEADYEKSVSAFCRRKYESDFAKEMNRSAAEYMKFFSEVF
jgi:nitroreductase